MKIAFLSSDKRDQRDENSQTPLSIRKFLMIPHQVFLIPRIFFDIFVIFDTVECHLAETVVICNISPVFFFTLAKCNNPFSLPPEPKRKGKKKEISHLPIHNKLHQPPRLLRIMHLRPPLDAILGHQIFRQRRRNAIHMHAIFLVCQTGFFVAQNRQAEIA